MAELATPARPLPGAFLNTPAANRFQTGGPVRQYLVQRNPSYTSQRNPQGTEMTSQSQSPNVTKPTSDALTPVERAAKTINETLKQELRYPELDSYVSRE